MKKLTRGFKFAIKLILPTLPLYDFLTRKLRAANLYKFNFVRRIPINKYSVIECQVQDVNFLLTNPDRCSIAKELYWSKGIRYPENDKYALELFHIYAKDADVILDIGCNTGIFSILGAKANSKARIYAFDILPEALSVLFNNLLLNQLLSNVKINFCGIGATKSVKGEVPFFPFSTEISSAFSMNFKYEKNYSVPVQFKSLDDLLDKIDNKNVLIKIDVEGTELEIFENAQKTLGLLRPNIMCEILVTTPSEKVKKIDGILSFYNYRKYLITSNGPVEKQHLESNKSCKDWFFTLKPIVN